MKNRAMVSVSLYADGSYVIKDIPNYYVTQYIHKSSDEKGDCIAYHCLRSRRYHYLLKLIDIQKKNTSDKVTELIDTLRVLDKVKNDIAGMIEEEE